MSRGRLTGSPAALADLGHDQVDRRLTRLLAVLLEHHDLNIRMVKAGHLLGPVTPDGRDSDHWHYRAVDIDAVDGHLVENWPSSDGAVSLGTLLLSLSTPDRPDHVLGPAAWHTALGGGAVTGFRDEPRVNERHHDHLHLGYAGPEVGPAI